ncbi:hypothetical protein BUE80_DR009813 [Diplocarpon rosae]|nr:hypothetical protein BUE80_DR009813 [Diplocarpon rosae]
MAPYQLNYGQEPRVSWDWKSPKPSSPQEKLNHAEARLIAQRMYAAWEVAKANMKQAQDRMSNSVNQHRRPIDWQPNDMVYLSTRNLKNYRPSKKLSNQWDGPFKVLEKVGNSYRIELPPGSTIHDVFAPELLFKDPQDPLPGQEQPRPTGEIIAGQEEFEVSKILGVRLLRNRLEYQVKWLGHDPDPAWYPASNFMGSPHKLRDFHQEYPTKPGPPRNLQAWLKAWEEGINDYGHLEDDAPLQKSRSARSKKA